ncbi:hypothetical protein KC717_02705 [Candidatus Dojkabacteria bacterium]|uniref:Uncharacterized protein n=1 Tax=Candidatus Dojkabacteria bacterium TaxID=2099670 RepID=A0A955L876_9BACT|nr:hypothetical protein [Candidatus Dojkabacteria bacterium]
MPPPGESRPNFDRLREEHLQNRRGPRLSLAGLPIFAKILSELRVNSNGNYNSVTGQSSPHEPSTHWSD